MLSATRLDTPRAAHPWQIATDLTPVIHIVFADNREIEIIDLLDRENRPERGNRVTAPCALEVPT